MSQTEVGLVERRVERWVGLAAERGATRRRVGIGDYYNSERERHILVASLGLPAVVPSSLLLLDPPPPISMVMEEVTNKAP